MSVRAGAVRTTPPLPLTLAPPPPPPASKQHKTSPAFGRPALLSREASSSSAHAAASQPVNRSQLLRLWQRKGGGSSGGGNALVTGSGAAGGGGGGGGGSSGVRPRRLLQMLALLLAASGYGLLLASNALVTVQQPPPSPHFQSAQESVSIRPLQSTMQQEAQRDKAESSLGTAEDAEQPGGFGEMGPEAMEAELEERRQTVHKVCAERGLGREGKPNAWEFFIDEKHRLVWCNIFKAASTAWLYKFNLLGGYKGSYLRRAVKPQLLLARARYPRPTPDQLLATLPDSLSFLIVREPFERLLSAYRNKLEGYRNRYYRKLAREIARRPRRPPPPTSSAPLLPVTAYGDVEPRTAAKPPPLSAMLSPTFEQFIDYVIETGLKAEKPHFDEHWAPIHKFCTPCHVNFTVIAKVETLARDEEYIIRRAGLKKALGEKQDPRKITNRARGARATAQLVAEYFATITQDQLRDLYSIYGTDFEMFGYNVTKYYDLARSDVAR